MLLLGKLMRYKHWSTIQPEERRTIILSNFFKPSVPTKTFRASTTHARPAQPAIQTHFCTSKGLPPIGTSKKGIVQFKLAAVLIL